MSTYPKNVALDGGAEVEIRVVTRADSSALLDFARQLPEEDLLFLRTDITEPDVIERWIQQVESGDSVSIAAFDAVGLIGYATVHRNAARWTRNIGEIRVNVGRGYRGKGLGRRLTSEIFDVARSLELRKLTASMTSDQKGAQAAFRRLGFIAEALLADYVEDRNGTPRDLVIMTHDVTGHTDTIDEPVKL